MKNWETPKGYIEKKYNYTYKLTFKNDPRYYYYGVHCTNHNPEYDNYFGSGTNVKKYKEIYGKDCFDKEILEFFATKKDALLAEDKLVPISLLSDEFCLNKIKGGGTFDTTGMIMSEEYRKKISKRIKGTKRTKESIEKMIKTRQTRGTDKHTEETKRKLSEDKKNRKHIYKDNISKCVKKEELEKYLSMGWKLGCNPERNKKVSLSKMGEKNPMYNKKKSQETIKKMNETKIKNGTNKHSEETKKKLTELNQKRAKDIEFRKRLSESTKGINTWSKGRVFINKNGIMKTCKPEDLENYLQNGWNKGRIIKK